jgi:hypothetical protein
LISVPGTVPRPMSGIAIATMYCAKTSANTSQCNAFATVP